MNKLIQAFSTCLNFNSKKMFKLALLERKIGSPLLLDNKELMPTVLEYHKLSRINYKLHDYQKQKVQNQEVEMALNAYETITEQLPQVVNDANISDVFRILLHYNVINLEIWKSTIEYFVRTVANLEYTKVNLCLKAINEFFKRFRIVEHTQYQLYFHEREIISIFSDQHYEILINSIRFDQNQSPILYMDILEQIIQIQQKLSRATPTNFFKQLNFIREQVSPMISYMEQYEIKHLMLLYNQLQEQNQIIQSEFQKLVHLLENRINTISDRKQIAGDLLEIWKHFGKYENSLYQLIREPILQLIKEQRQLGGLVKIAYSCVTAQIQDELLMAELILAINKLHLQFANISQFQKQSLHLFFRLIEIRYPHLITDVKLSQKSNAHCCGQEEPQSTCILKDLNKTKTQNQTKGTQEEIIVNGLIGYIQNNSREPVRFLRDCKACQYSIDLAILIADSKIAVEVSGLNYSDSGELKGKKKNKKEILQFDHWHTIFIETSSQEMQRMLTTENSKGLQDLYSQTLDEIEANIYRKLR